MLANLRIALVNLNANKLRTLLTMLGVLIGVAAVIVLVSFGQAVDVFVRDQFTGVGVNLVFVVGGQNGRGGFNALTQRDADAISDPLKVPSALEIAPQRDLTNRVLRFGNREITGRVQGVLPNYLAMYNRELAAGRFIDERDVETSARVALVESDVVSDLFGETYPIGQNIRVADVRFTVIGILSSQGAGTFGPGAGVIIPITTAQTRLSGERILSGGRPVSFIGLRAKDADAVDSLVREVRQTLREARGIAFRDEDDFIVFTQDEILDTLGSITSLLTVFLALLASISLVVGGIGIMNIMLVTVTERTREIGLRKAVGARKRDVLAQFLTEAVVLSLLGGMAGVLLAVLLSLVVGLLLAQAALELTLTVQLSSVVLATVISILVGVLSGIYPANRAANLNPIDALRYE